jgi:hypothetical protein
MRYSGLHPRDIYGAADTQKISNMSSNPPTNLVHLTVDAWAHGRRWFVALILQVLFFHNLLFLPDGLSSFQRGQLVLEHPLDIGNHLCCPLA